MAAGGRALRDPIGRDGFAMLAPSCGVVVASFGLGAGGGTLPGAVARVGHIAAPVLSLAGDEHERLHGGPSSARK